MFLCVASLLLYVGLSVAPVVVLPLVALAFVGAILVARRRVRTERQRNAGRDATGAAGAALVATPLILLAAGAITKPLYHIDAMLNWVMKAKVIWAGGTA